MGSFKHVRQPERLSLVGSRLDTAASATFAGNELLGGAIQGSLSRVEGRVQHRA